MGIGGELSFTNLGSRAMDDASSRFDKLVSGANQFKTAAAGLASIGQPVAGAVKGMFGLFTDFEAQMSVVSSKMGVLSQTDPEGFEKLNAKAKELGAATSFTATQVGEGLEQLATAGFSVEEQIGAIGGILDTAAADGLSMARATEIVAGVLRGMGMEVTETARATNTLAYMSKSTMTDINKLGHAFSYAMPVATQLGMNVEDLGAAIGMMGNSMLQSGRGGRNLASMLTKIIKPSKEGAGLMDQMKFKMTKMVDGVPTMKRMPEVIAELTEKFNAIQDPMERARAKVIMFGAEGGRAWNALEKGGAAAFESLVAGAKEAQKENLIRKMADERLNNLKGDLTILTSAMEGFAIEVSSAFGGQARDSVKRFTNLVSGITATLQALAAGGETDTLREKFGNLPVDIAIGIRKGIELVGGALDWLKTKFNSLSSAAFGGLGEGGTQAVATFATMAVAGLTMLMPLLGGLRLLGGIVTGVLMPVFRGLSLVMSAAFWPVLVAIVVVGLAFMILRRDGESFGETATRVFGYITEAAIWLWQNVLEPMWSGIVAAATQYFPMLQATVMQVFTAIGDLIYTVFSMFDGLLDGNGETLKWLTETVIGGFLERLNTGLAFLKVVIESITGWLKTVGTAWRQILDGDFLGALKTIGAGIVDYLLEPLRWVTREIIGLADNIPGSEYLVPQALRDFAFSGLGFQNAKAKLASGDDLDSAGGSVVPSSYVPIAAAAADATEGQSKKNAKLTGAEMGAAMGEEHGELLSQIAANTGKECPPPNLKVNLDGREVNKGLAKRQQELRDRLGKQTAPWTRRQAAEQGWNPGD